MLQADRDYSACTLAANPTQSFACGGSATNAGGTFTDFSNYALTVDTVDAMRNTDALSNTQSADLYNFGPLNYYQRPERRYSLGAMGHYEFGEHADVYTQLMYSDYESLAQIAPGGNFGDTTTINCDNPLFPQGSLATIGCGPAEIAAGTSVPMYILRRNVEGGGRQQSFANSSFRIVGGVRGAINEAWGYDASMQYSTTSVDATTLNYFVVSRMQNALDVIDVGGVPTCRSVVDGSDPNCVPWNPFVPNGINQAQLDYLQATGIQSGRISQEIYNGVVNGDLGVYGVKSPLATRRHPGRVRRRVSARCAAQQRRRAPDGQPALWRRRRGDRHQRRHEGQRTLHGSPGPDRSGPGVRGEPLLRHRLPLLGLR